MAHPHQMEYALLSQITPARHNWSIKVRVARMWKLSWSSRSKGMTAMELVLVDEEGVGIAACIGHKDLGKFANSLVEGRSYMIKKFQVSKQARKYNPVPNPQTIYFTPWTIVEEIPPQLATQLPLYHFNFKDFEDLDRRPKTEKGLVDVIGQLTVVHPVVRSSSLNGVSVRRVVELRDLSDHLLQITLWGDHATSFEEQILLQTIDNDEPTVIVFAGVQVKPYQGAPTCVSGDGTKWYLNIELPEMNAFRASLQGRGPGLVFLPGDDAAQGGVGDEASANRKTIEELLALDPHDRCSLFTCNATIREIDVSTGWWYKGCSVCKRGLKATFDGFECTNCDDDKPVVIPSYKLSVIIEDTTGSVKMFLFGGVAEQVVRRTAADLVLESSTNQILLPAPLRGLVGRRYVFQVVISEQTFRTGQLSFQARRVFPDPAAAEGRGPAGRPPQARNVIGTSSVAKDSPAQDLAVSEVGNDSEGGSTPPPIPHKVAGAQTSSNKRKEVPSTVEEEDEAFVAKRPRSTRRQLSLDTKTDWASDE